MMMKGPGRPEGNNRAELETCEIVAIDGNFILKMSAEELNSSTNTIQTS